MIETEQNKERKKKLIENNDHYLAVKLHNKELEKQMQQNILDEINFENQKKQLEKEKKIKEKEKNKTNELSNRASNKYTEKFNYSNENDNQNDYNNYNINNHNNYNNFNNNNYFNNNNNDININDNNNNNNNNNNENSFNLVDYITTNIIKKNKGLKPEEINEFVIQKWKKNIPDKNCVICQEMFNINDMVRRLPCLHTFHQNCIDKWLESNSKCPTCLFNLKKNK